MREITITANDAGRRLDRFLRKYLSGASLGEIYKLIRKDVKVDGKRRPESYMLQEGETLALYISDDVLDRLAGSSSGHKSRNASAKAKRQFRIIYEDSDILIADKPYGLLTHGDRTEKKRHLANQVRDYLIETGEYDPREEKVFAPAPANRLDRNTTGLVLFGKTSAALKGLNQVIREDLAAKFYLTIAHGVIDRDLILTGNLSKDEALNKVRISDIQAGSLRQSSAAELADAYGHAYVSGSSDHGHSSDDSSLRPVITIVHPLEVLDMGNGCKATFTEIRLVTGRSHQIRAHLAGIGHPLIGDAKYAKLPPEVSSRFDSAADPTDIRRLNDHLARTCNLTTQLLHAYAVSFAPEGLPEDIAYLSGRNFTAPPPPAFRRILESAGASISITGENIGY